MNKYLESYMEACLVTIFALIGLLLFSGYMALLIYLLSYSYYIEFILAFFMPISLMLAMLFHLDKNTESINK
jgi:hypothetical protein